MNNIGGHDPVILIRVYGVHSSEMDEVTDKVEAIFKQSAVFKNRERDYIFEEAKVRVCGRSIGGQRKILRIDHSPAHEESRKDEAKEIFEIFRGLADEYRILISASSAVWSVKPHKE